MSAQGMDPQVPSSPGRILRGLMNLRLSPGQRDSLLSELHEMYRLRCARDGVGAADRWLRREYRTLLFRLLRGGAELAAAGLGESGRHGLRPSAGSGGWGRDLKQNFRGLMRAPVFSLAVALTVGAGIGGTTLVYGVVHSVLIEPMPYPGADRMVLIRHMREDNQWGTSMADLEALSDLPPAFEAIESYSWRTQPVDWGGEVELLRTKWVTDGYLGMLGLTPELGRGFTEGEGDSPGADVAMVTPRFAERAWGSVAAALGSTLTMAGSPVTVVGVLPQDTGPLDASEIFPLLRVATPDRKGPFFFQTVGRVREGTEMSVADAQLRAVSERIYPVWQASFQDSEARMGLLDLKEILVGDVSRALKILLAGVAGLLLIAIANAASLLVARGMERVREISIRSALGASRNRLIRLMLGEAVLLAGAGAVIGLGIAGGGMALIRRFGVDSLPRVQEVTLTLPVLSFMAATTAISALIFGLIAALTVLARRTDGLASNAARATSSTTARAVRRGLVTAQFAVTIPLLIGAGLLARSLDRLKSVDMGFDPQGMVSMLVSLPDARYSTEEDVLAFWDELIPRIEGLPSVARAGLADARPPAIYPQANNFKLEGDGLPPSAPQPTAPWITATPGYLETLGLRLIEGSLFAPVEELPLTVVVDEAWVANYSADRPAVGRRFRSGGCVTEGCNWVVITGVVSDVKNSGLDDAGRGTIYFNFASGVYWQTNLHLRATGDPLTAAGEVARLIRGTDSAIPIADIMTVDDVASESLAGRRYGSLLVLLFASVALFLTVVGIYGSMSYFVRQHRKEIGIRMALGGGPEGALRLVVLQGLRIAVVGILLGVVGAYFLAGTLERLLFEVAPRDPMVFAGVVGLTGLMAILASAIPGRIAAATDPAVTLRDE